MSRGAGVYVGPYAMLPPGTRVLDPNEGPLPDGLEYPRLLLGYGKGFFRGAVAVEGTAGRPVAVLTPGFEDCRGVPCTRFDSDYHDYGASTCTDLLAVDREAAVSEFRRAYADDLSEIAKLVDREWVFGWGVLFTVS